MRSVHDRYASACLCDACIQSAQLMIKNNKSKHTIVVEAAECRPPRLLRKEQQRSRDMQRDESASYSLFKNWFASSCYPCQSSDVGVLFAVYVAICSFNLERWCLVAKWPISSVHCRHLSAYVLRLHDVPCQQALTRQLLLVFDLMPCHAYDTSSEQVQREVEMKSLIILREGTRQ